MHHQQQRQINHQHYNHYHQQQQQYHSRINNRINRSVRINDNDNDDNNHKIRITSTHKTNYITTTSSSLHKDQQQQQQKQPQQYHHQNINIDQEFIINSNNDDNYNDEKGRFLDFNDFINLESTLNSNNEYDNSITMSNYNNNGNNDDGDQKNLLTSTIITKFGINNNGNVIAADEARYNLATRIMSNGVEVIVASDKSKIPQLSNNNKQSVHKIIPSNLQKPMTLAPSTLKDQMILVMPSDKKNNLTISINPNNFLTKTCLTTYTYRTTYLQDGTTTIESREKVISNIATEERNYLKISPTVSSGIVLSKTPELAVGVFRTTYKYLNTFIDGEQPIVVSSKHVVTNTITGPNDYISFLQPSKDATPVHDTNTYFTKIMLTKTFQKNGVSKVLSTSNILTQVVITESLPPKSISVMTSYIAFDDDDDDNDDKEDENNENDKNKDYINKDNNDEYNDSTDDKNTINKSRNKSTSIKNKNTKITPTRTLSSPTSISSSSLSLSLSSKYDNKFVIYDDDNMKNDDNFIYSSENDISTKVPSATTVTTKDKNNNNPNNIYVYATKTYLTTFTYFTTLLKSNKHEISSSIIDSHTRITENVITETIPNYVLNTNLLKTLSHLLLQSGTKNPKSITTMAILPDGQSLEITAVKNNLITKHHHSSTKQIEITSTTSSSSSSSISTRPLITNANINYDDINSDNNNYNNSDSIDDNEPAETTNNEETYDEQQYNNNNVEDTSTIPSSKIKNRNSTKISTYRPEFPPVSNIINSLNLDGLTALGPVFNAMAGIIQNNFKTNSNNIKKNNSSYNIENRYTGKNISSTSYENDDSTLNHHQKQQHHEPIYIPVQNINNEIHQNNNNHNNGNNVGGNNNNHENLFNFNHGSPQSLHVSPPPLPDKWITDEKMNRNNKLVSSNENKLATYEQPLLNGGIPISPGEVITANSDVIVGKPAGTRPRIPFNNGKLQNEQKITTPSTTISSLIKPNVPKYLSLSKYFENNKNILNDKNYEQYMRPPPPPPPFVAESQMQLKQFLKHSENVGNNRKRVPYHSNKIPLIPHRHHHHLPPSPLPPQKNDYEHPQHIPISNNFLTHIKTPNDNGNNNNNPIKTTEILEIKKMPEIYSTNLPLFEVYAHQHSHIKKVIGSGKPMLVNIQPSQVANVVIPHGNSASVLIIESPVELHKNGEYFDEPSPYPNTVFSKTPAQSTDREQRQKPISSNQQINLHAGVLNHNVDINVPPLTFRKETEFPHSTPIKGHNSQNVRKNGPFEMPHITILPTDQEIHVNLTPQHYILSEIVIRNDNLYSENKFSPLPLPVKRKPFQNYKNESFTYANKTNPLILNHSKYSNISQQHHKYPSISNLKRPLNLSPIHLQTNNKFGNNVKQHLEKLIYPQTEFSRPLPPSPSFTIEGSHQLLPLSPPPRISQFSSFKNAEDIYQKYGVKNPSKDVKDQLLINQRPLQGSSLKQPLNSISPVNNYQSPPPFKYQPPQKLRPLSHIPSIESIFDMKLSKPSSQKPMPFNTNVNIAQNHVQKSNERNHGNVFFHSNQTNSYPENTGIYSAISNKTNLLEGDTSPPFNSYYDNSDYIYDSDSKSSEQNIEKLKNVFNKTEIQNYQNNKEWSTIRSTNAVWTNNSTTTERTFLNNFKNRPALLDTPSALDINKLHHIKTAPSLSSSSVQEPLSIFIPSKGRPFHVRYPYTKKPAVVTNSQQTLFQDDLIHLPKPGQRFRKPSFSNNKINNVLNSMTTNSIYDNSTDYIQMSLPINSYSSDTDIYKISQTQTEAPFTSDSKHSHDFHNQNYYANDVDETTTMVTTITSSNWNLDLNTLEVVTKSKPDNDRDSGEIFDFRESVNPHNLGVVSNSAIHEQNTSRNTTKGTSKFPSKNYGNRLSTIRHSVLIPTTSYPFVSELSVNMKPPAPSLITNEVMGLSPPPPPTSLSPPPSTSISSSLPSSPSSTYDASLLNNNYMNTGNKNANTVPTISRPFISRNHSKFSNNHTPPKQFDYSHQQEQMENKKHITIPTTRVTATKTTTKKMIEQSTISSTTVKLPQPTRPVYSITVKPDTDTDAIQISTEEITSKPKIQNQSSTQTKQITKKISPTPITKNEFYNYIPMQSSDSPTNKNSSRLSPIYTSMLDESQAISDDILMLGSEQKYKEDITKHFIYPTPDESDIEKTIILLPEDNITTINKSWLSTNNIEKEYSTPHYTTVDRKIENKIKATKTLDQSKDIISDQTPIMSSTPGIPTIIEIVTKAHTERVNVYPTKTQIKVYASTSTTPTSFYVPQKHKNYHQGFTNGTVIVVSPPVVKMKAKPTIQFEIIDYEEKTEKNTKSTYLRPSITISSVSLSPSPAVHLAPSSSSTISVSRSSTASVLPSLSTTILTSAPPSTSLPSSPTITFIEKHNRKDSMPSNSILTDNESIFVVMTDKSNSGGIIHFNGSVLDAENSVDEPDYTSISFDVPDRDEDFASNEANHVLLGGILIASPPKSKDISKYSSTVGSSASECRPDCKASRNELCQRVENVMRCVCRPGFARMFPDRPCKPTYTYSLRLKLHRFGSDPLHFHDYLNNRDSDAYFYLSGITHEALDRMVMQSDFRDVYHGVHVTSFEKSDNDDGIYINFYLQLSDNSDENRLIDVFKKYLRTKNYSIGGTELHTSKEGVEELKASDFNECLHSQFHDCSENSYCFNLHGTYTCSCKEGYADLSENSMYPGRICSTELIGCEQCHYHGTCYTPDDTEHPICECFHWYAGSACQINLKILLIALIAIGTILLILLCFCIGVLCIKKHKTSRSIQTLAGINIIPPKNLRHFNPSNIKIDKRAMIKDSSSETSHNSDVLPYVSKKEDKKSSVISQSHSIQKINAQQQQRRQQQQQQYQQHQQQAEIERRCSLLDQNNRSLSVMIPRAKYHSSSHQLPSSPHLIISEINCNGGGGGNRPVHGRNSCNPEVNSKILSYLDAGAQISNVTKKISSSSMKHSALHTTSTGALVSAGFEVSATVRQDTGLSSGDENNHCNQKLIDTLEHQKRTNLDDTQSQFDDYKTHENQQGAFMENMDNWFDTMQQNELTASEARSYDETTIRPQTKSFRTVYETHVSQLNDEANTMAEREVGSTFLLPHTHLYKPDRASDMSGFDSY